MPDQKLERLKELLSGLAPGGLCLAFSGGVDSALLLAVCRQVSKNPVHAVTMQTPFHSLKEPEETARLAVEFGARHHIITLDALEPALANNPPDRCYLCKKWLFSAIREYAAAHALATVMDGTNADDLGEYRPGLRALEELGVRSPLAELGVSKPEVRAMAAGLGVSVAQKPSTPCLATRFPYNTPLSTAAMQKADDMERLIRSQGISVLRVRVYGDTLRIEVLPESFHDLLAHRVEINKAAHGLGFLYITMDMEGFRSGSMDRNCYEIS